MRRGRAGRLHNPTMRGPPRVKFVVRKRTVAAWTLTSCLKLQGPTQADVVPRVQTSCGHVRGSSVGSLHCATLGGS